MLALAIYLAAIASILPKIALSSEPTYLVEVITAQPPFPSNPVDEIARGQVVPIWTDHAKSRETIPGMSVHFECSDDGYAEISGHIGFQIDGRRIKAKDMEHRAMLGIDVLYDGRRVRGTVANENAERGQHYHVMPFDVTIPVRAGSHTVDVRGRTIMFKGQLDMTVSFMQRDFHLLQVKLWQPDGGDCF